MINIFESQSIKVIGSTSLKLSFNYNQEVIDKIHLIGDGVWLKELSVWEFPCNKLSELVNELTYLDDITLEIENEQEDESKLTITQEFKTKMFDYQKEGVEWLINNPNGLLLDPPGLGKSIQTIYAAEELKARGLVDKCLIICGINSLKTNWKKEVQRHSKFNAIIIGERINSKGRTTYASIKDRAEQLYNKIDEFFVILNVESLRDKLVLEAIKSSKNKFDMIVFDEVHKCLEYSSLVDTDRGKLQIGYIVDNKIDCNVKSYNEVTKQIEYKPILNYFDNSNRCDIVHLTIEDDRGMIHDLECTYNHKILTRNRGWVEAQFLNERDDVVCESI